MNGWCVDTSYGLDNSKGGNLKPGGGGLGRRALRASSMHPDCKCNEQAVAAKSCGAGGKDQCKCYCHPGLYSGQLQQVCSGGLLYVAFIVMLLMVIMIIGASAACKMQCCTDEGFTHRYMVKNRSKAKQERKSASGGAMEGGSPIKSQGPAAAGYGATA